MQDQANTIYDVLSSFLQNAQKDVRLTSTHISVYCVLFEQWLEHDCVNPFAITRRKIMGLSKISIATYHKVMAELNRYGYLTYLPSYHPALGSRVYLHFEPRQWDSNDFSAM